MDGQRDTTLAGDLRARDQGRASRLRHGLVLRGFEAGGFTLLELLLLPRTLDALEAMAPVLQILDTD